MDIPEPAIPGPPTEDDFDLDAHLDWLMAEIDAGRQQVPPASRLQSPAVSISLGEATDLDPQLLAALCGPDGLAGPGGPGGPALNEAFAQGRPADVLRPGPVLAALTEQALADLHGLTDDQLTGALHAAGRLASRAFYLQTVAVAEFARRRAVQLEAARAATVPRGCRPGEYPDLELAAELLVSRRHAGRLMDQATELATRLPRTLAGMANGTVDPARARAIAGATLCLTAEDAARADEILAADAHEIRADTLARRAAALAMKLDPEAARREKEDAKATRQRVEARREFSGNASLSARELATADAMACKANIDAIAAALRNAGLEGTLDHLRVLAFTDLTQSRNPLDRIAARQQAMAARLSGPGPGPASQTVHPQAATNDPEEQDRQAEESEPDEGGARYPAGPGTPAGGLAPLPALINLIWVFESFLNGMTPYAIAETLNRRGEPTALGRRWSIPSVLRLLDSRQVAGIRVFRGEEIGPGNWPAIITEAMFREAQERRAYRSDAHREKYEQRNFYLLRGLLWCSKCGVRMSGHPEPDGRRIYVCSNFRPASGLGKCYRRIGAATLEAFVRDAAIDLLERLDVSGSVSAAVLSDADNAAIDADQAELAELKAMWDAREITTSEYREMRKTVEDRIRRIEAKTVIRPAVEVLAGMTGPDARPTWAHEKAGNLERLNAVLRFLFAAIRLGESTAPNGKFDYGRIEIEQNSL